jgi:hypothetical protein
MLRASTTHASRRDANSRKCWESGGGLICRVADELVVPGGFDIALIKARSTAPNQSASKRAEKFLALPRNKK